MENPFPFPFPPKPILLLLPFLLSLIACTPQPASQCRQFANITQQSKSIRESFDSDIADAQVKISAAQDLATLQTAAQDYTAAFERVITQLDTMSQAFEQINIADEQLDDYRDRYISFIANTKTALTEGSAAMQLVIDAKTEADFSAIFATFTSQSNAAYSNIQKLDQQEDDILNQFNAYCTETLGLADLQTSQP
ncbi:MAG: hypothetical protein HC800_16385 [Phormidesmis sp. RL_2_1]|nr:hypothetical protein [Phormidesmis sp. RL_2_1]